MKVQLSPTRIVKDATTVWHEPGQFVDVTMDLHNLTFRPGSVDELCVFHVLDHLFPHEIEPAMQNWFTCLKDGSELYTIDDDFEYLARSFVGGELSINEFNQKYTHPTQITRDNLLAAYIAAGFDKDKVVMFHTDVPDHFRKQNHEIVMSSQKHE